MNKVVFVVLISIFVGCNQPIENEIINNDSSIESKSNKTAIVIHGGAGNMQATQFDEEKTNLYLGFLDSVVSYGYELLELGANGQEVVVKVLSLLEDSPLFNAGRGAVLTNEATHELDASIMHGKTLNAGAVAGVKNIKNPIQLAALVMDSSEHVFLAREGAEAFADHMGIPPIDPSYFLVPDRLDALKRIQAKEKENRLKDDKFGTVGCVVLDLNGDIVAGTSTGGMTNKRFGRVGDSPIIGAGTYANNATCGLSATGWGEFFIRSVAVHDIHAQMQYANKSLLEAASDVVMNKIPSLGGDGGVIGVDKTGNIVMVFNTSGMFRAGIDGDGTKQVAIFK